MKQPLPNQLDQKSSRTISLIWRGGYIFALTSLFPLIISAQEETSAEGDVFELSPFEVDASQDTGYLASQTLAGTRLRTNLEDISASVQIITEDFMDDLGVVDAEDLLLYTTGTEVFGLGGNFSGATSRSTAKGGVDINDARNDPGAGNRVRGVGSATRARDYFVTDLPFDRYNTGRVEINRGPNSILFGLGSPAGVINQGLDTAYMRDFAEIEHSLRKEGNANFSHRGEFTINKEVIDDLFAIRIAGMVEDRNYSQQPAYQDQERLYAAITIKPIKNLTIRANFEDATINANRPDPIGPLEAITPYLDMIQQVNSGEYEGAGIPMVFDPYMAAANVNLGVIDPETAHLPYSVPPNIALKRRGGGSGADLYNFRTAMAGRASMGFFYDENSPDITATFPTSFNLGNISKDALPGGGDYAGLQPRWLVGPGSPEDFTSIPYGNLMPYRNNKPPEYNRKYKLDMVYIQNVGRELGKKQVGLTDFSLFNWDDYMLFGNSSFQNLEYETGSISIQQDFLDRTLGYEVAVYKEESDRTNFSAFTGNDGCIFVDFNRTLPIGIAPGSTDPVSFDQVPLANPGFGRLFIMTNNGNQQDYHEEREEFRFSPYMDLNFEELFDGKGISKWLGRHVISGIYNDREHSFTRRTFAEVLDFNQGPEAVGYEEAYPGQYQILSEQYWQNISNNPNWLHAKVGAAIYLGDAIDLDTVDPYSLKFDSFHINGTVDGSKAVNFGATRNVTFWDARPEGSGPNGNEGQQWISLPVNTRAAFNAGGQVKLETVETWGGAVQSYWLRNHLVTTFGIRRDNVSQFVLNTATRHTQANLYPETGDPWVNAEGYIEDDPTTPDFNESHTLDNTLTEHNDLEEITRTFGAVVKFPEELFFELPFDADLRAYFNISENYEPEPGQHDMFGNLLPPTTGETTEYGIMLTMFENKLNLRLNHYEVKQSHNRVANSHQVINDVLARQGTRKFIGALYNDLASENPEFFNPIVRDPSGQMHYSVEAFELAQASQSGDPQDEWVIFKNPTGSLANPDETASYARYAELDDALKTLHQALGIEFGENLDALINVYNGSMLNNDGTDLAPGLVFIPEDELIPEGVILQGEDPDNMPANGERLIGGGRFALNLPAFDVNSGDIAVNYDPDNPNSVIVENMDWLAHYDVLLDQNGNPVIGTNGQPILNVSNQTLLPIVYVDTLTNGDSTINETNELVSEGWELEGVWNPTRSWRIGFNLTKNETTTQNSFNNFGPWLLDPETGFLNTIAGSLTGSVEENNYVFTPNFIGTMDAQNPASSDYGSVGSIGRYYISEIVDRVVQAQSLDGISNPEIREWRFNMLTNYTFQDGLFENLSIGGNVRWQSGATLDYATSEVDVDGVMVGISDVRRRWESPDVLDIGLRLGYSKKFEKFTWDIRVNVDNIYRGGDDVIPVSVQPQANLEDMQVVEVRTRAPLSWRISNRIKF